MSLTMKDEILQKFLQASGEPISGQKLADDFGVSRTAIWKHMQALQVEGYTFETIKKKGYLLTSVPDRVDVAQVTANLETKRLGRTIHHFEETTTTMLNAHDLVREGVEDGTIVLAERQTAGRGRMLRHWETAAGKGIWMTVILKPDVLPHQAPQFTLVAAVAVVNAMKAMFKTFTPKIKWPNDILINGRKCTGILTEMIAESDRVQALLIGIGINVNQQITDFPDDLQTIATSMAIEHGETIDRALFLANLLYFLEHYVDLYIQRGFGPIKELWEEASGTIGQQVRATTLREVIEGEAIGITETGVLEIRTASGEIKGVYSADIEIQ